MRIIQLTQSMEALCDDQDLDWLNQWIWYYDGRYARRNTGYGTHIRMHEAIAERMGLIGQIDHKDENRLNNQRSNLRVATKSQNGANRGTNTNNTSGYKGACWNRQRQKWQATIMFEKRTIYLGLYDSAIEAAQAYDRAALRLQGRYAKLNFPRSP